MPSSWYYHNDWLCCLGSHDLLLWYNKWLSRWSWSCKLMSSPHDHDPSAIVSPKQVRQSFLSLPLSRPTTSLTRCDFEHARVLVFEIWARRVERWSGVKKSPSCCRLELHARPRNLNIRQKQQHIRGSWTRSQAPTIHISFPGCETPISKADTINAYQLIQSRSSITSVPATMP